MIIFLDIFDNIHITIYNMRRLIIIINKYKEVYTMNFENILPQDESSQIEIETVNQREQLADLTLKYFISFGGNEELY